MAERRERARALLTRALQGDHVLAHNLELAVYNHCVRDARHRGVPRYWDCERFAKGYSAKACSMAYNLRAPANPKLLQQVLGGALTVQELVELPAQAMFPERWTAVLRDVARMARSRMAPQPGFGAHEGAFACGRCKSKRTVYHQMQTRSADEPMTTFVTCLDCGKRWKV